MPPTPFCIALPKVSLTCMNTTVFGVMPDAANICFWFAKASPRIMRRGREIAEHELVALLGDRRGGRDVDDEGNAPLFGDLRDRGDWPESKAPTRSCAPSLISFSAGVRAICGSDSVSPFMIWSGGRPSCLRMPGRSRRRAGNPGRCRPARPSAAAARRPSAAAPCARTMLNGAVPATRPAAPRPAAKVRRVTRE